MTAGDRNKGRMHERCCLRTDRGRTEFGEEWRMSDEIRKAEEELLVLILSLQNRIKYPRHLSTEDVKLKLWASHLKLPIVKH